MAFSLSHEKCMIGTSSGLPSLTFREEDPVTGLRTYAKPMGVLCCSAPSTTPVFNIIFVAIHGLKSGNAVISCPHPNAKKCAIREIEVMREALASVGAPMDLLQVVEEPTIELSGLLMEACDAIIAVGGTNMVKAAYSKGKPCFGVGQGNVQTLLGKEYTELDNMAKEMMEYTKMNVLVQSAQAMLAQANQQPQSVLQLLQ